MENNVNKTTQQSEVIDVDALLGISPSSPASIPSIPVTKQPAKSPSNQTSAAANTKPQPAAPGSNKINNPFEVSKYKNDAANTTRTIATHKFVPSKLGLTLGIVGCVISGVALLGALLMLVL